MDSGCPTAGPRVARAARSTTMAQLSSASYAKELPAGFVVLYILHSGFLFVKGFPRGLWM